jgi:hypothetical protein
MELTLEVTETKRVPVKYLRAECGVRYWEDATVNGVEDTDGALIPCRDPKPNDHLGGGTWRPLIDLDTGRIVDWPQGTTAEIHYKVCDDGLYRLLDEQMNEVRAVDGYVITMMCPEGQGYGDYVIMKVGEDGSIANWKIDFSDFVERERA